ncbi:JmjC domain protein [Ancylostoma caninum]|uniref:JmjC domain protein n=1 Tax=Ancylostoma caninum TaxID=29170 RepID=A0A368FTY5_ANCCA|nr:JmjC domain protein [Ancylostoma caninum]
MSTFEEEAEKLRSAGAKYAQQVAESAGVKRKRVGLNGDDCAMPLKMLKFGTNVDLSDDTKWKAQIQELSKMPPFCRIIAGCNMLSHLGHTVLGMNTTQLYMKVPGSRTPAHQENNCFASININVGPGDCEWFGCPYEYWGVIERMCRERNLNFLKGSFWPNFEDLIDEGVPVYRFTQKAGDLVWVGGGCVHWVQATGWCNNIAWNVGPVTASQLQISIFSYEWNKLQSYKSLVPMQHLCWQLAKNIRFTNQKVFSLIRGQLIRSLAFCKMVADLATSRGKQLKPQPRAKGEITHYCTLCEASVRFVLLLFRDVLGYSIATKLKQNVLKLAHKFCFQLIQVEVFNILFVKEINGKFPVYCVYCARRAGLDDFIVLQQLGFHDLVKIFDNMQMNLIQKAALVC